MQAHLDSINFKLQNIKEFVDGVAGGILSGLVIDGEPGIGKTHTVLNHFEENHPKIKVTRFAGHITPLQAYYALGDNREAGNVIIFDDADSIFQETASLNTLKAAVDTRSNRIVSWSSSFRDLKYQSFQFQAGVIILTNANFVSAHFKAFLDRIHILEMKVSREEKLAKILEISQITPGLNADLGLSIATWIIENEKQILDLSIRTFVKAVDLAKFTPNWRTLATLTLFKEPK